MYTLTDTNQIACHGSFTSIAEARNYAYELRKIGLCKTYNIGTYIDGKWEVVYNSGKGEVEEQNREWLDKWFALDPIQQRMVYDQCEVHKPLMDYKSKALRYAYYPVALARHCLVAYNYTRSVKRSLKLGWDYFNMLRKINVEYWKKKGAE